MPTRVIKPRVFDVYLQIRETIWRRVRFELSPDQAEIGDLTEPFPRPSLQGFGLPGPDELVRIALRSQIAQKLHAVADPHDPPHLVNERARELQDLLALRAFAEEIGAPTLKQIRDSVEAVFSARAREAEALGLARRMWPATGVKYPSWERDYAIAAGQTRVAIGFDEAVKQISSWMRRIANES